MIVEVEKSGEMSVRDVEEFLIHPNEFKRNLGVGQAIMLVPHEAGTKTVKIKFDRFPDVRAKALPIVEKANLPLLETFKKQSREDAEPASTETKTTQTKTETSLLDDLIKNSKLAA